MAFAAAQPLEKNSVIPLTAGADSAVAIVTIEIADREAELPETIVRSNEAIAVDDGRQAGGGSAGKAARNRARSSAV
jgi:hypothetical protein